MKAIYTLLIMLIPFVGVGQCLSNLQIERGAIEDGQSVLEKIIQNNEYDPIIRDLATYYLLMLKIDSISQNEFESYLDDTRIQSSSFKYL